jgi:hypothetical protein
MIDISDINLKVIHVLDLQIEDCYFLFQLEEIVVFIVIIVMLRGSMFVYIYYYIC